MKQEWQSCKENINEASGMVNEKRWNMQGELKVIKLRRSTSVGDFLPPISCIGKNGKPLVLFKSFRKDERFVLKQVRTPTQELLHAYREDGRLKLQFMQPNDESMEHQGFEEEGDLMMPESMEEESMTEESTANDATVEDVSTIEWTEGLGSESCDDAWEYDTTNEMKQEWQSCKENINEASGMVNEKRWNMQGELEVIKLRRSTSVGDFLPPISCIGMNGKPLVLFKSFRKDGRTEDSTTEESMEEESMTEESTANDATVEDVSTIEYQDK
ncbi:putative Beta-ureidopropionase [Hibiscus syriacus]|uniref:Beta-ureidopropionase n=1 Tax=Hibiscus syriacus TaxID=106335 RepID=A0A6A3D1W7_HIBSY|nr:putative Beta-ureidopropionase [Hibiscus syriacus]